MKTSDGSTRPVTRLAPAKPGLDYSTCGGENAGDFINDSIYIGSRISGAASVDASKRPKSHDVFLRVDKTGKPLYA